LHLDAYRTVLVALFCGALTIVVCSTVLGCRRWLARRRRRSREQKLEEQAKLQRSSSFSTPADADAASRRCVAVCDRPLSTRDPFSTGAELAGVGNYPILFGHNAVFILLDLNDRISSSGDRKCTEYWNDEMSKYYWGKRRFFGRFGLAAVGRVQIWPASVTTPFCSVTAYVTAYRAACVVSRPQRPLYAAADQSTPCRVATSGPVWGRCFRRLRWPSCRCPEALDRIQTAVRLRRPMTIILPVPNAGNRSPSPARPRFRFSPRPPFSSRWTSTTR